MALIDTVKSCPLFYELYDEEIDIILDESSVVSFDANDVIIAEDDEGDSFYIILSGKAAVTKNVGEHCIKVSELKTGDAFGETVLINDNKRMTTISAASNCDVLIIDSDSIFSLYNTKPKIFSILILNLARLLAHRLSTSSKAISSFHGRFKRSA